MRRVVRPALDAAVQQNLDQRQVDANQKQAAGALMVAVEWKTARQSAQLRSVFGTLHGMMGDRQRCMYCLDSHGTDIDHFWPKTPYPARMFVWPNLLLCCTECGRIKGNRFLLSGAGEPMLVDPTAEDPWDHLDFDPATGNVVARFIADANDWSAKGLKTVEVLQLDRREALAVGYARTYRRLSSVVERHLQDGMNNIDAFVASLREADDHGLLGWCVMSTGGSLPPFSELRVRHPAVWTACVNVVQAAMHA